MADRTVGQGDTLPALDVILEADGVPVNLVGCSVSVTVEPLEGGADLLTAADCWVDPDQNDNPGHVIYQWQHGDTAMLGFYLAQFAVIDAANDLWHFPNEGRYTVQIVPVLD